MARLKDSEKLFKVVIKTKNENGWVKVVYGQEALDAETARTVCVEKWETEQHPEHPLVPGGDRIPMSRGGWRITVEEITEDDWARIALRR